MPPLRLRVYAHGDLLIIHNPELGAAVAIAGWMWLTVAGSEADHPLEFDFALPGWTLAYGVGLTVEEAISERALAGGSSQLS